VIAGIERFGVDAGFRDGASALEERPQRASLQRRLFRRAGEIEDRRCEVDVLHRHGDARRPVAPRQFDDERHPRRLAIEKEAVLLFAMIAEPFAVIGKQDDGGAVVEIHPAQAIEEAPDDLVGVGDLAVVRRVGAKPCRRRVGLVRLVDVEEEEERLGAVAPLEPGFRDRQRLFAAALHLPDRQLARRRGHVAVVRVEALADTRRLPQHECRHEAAGRPAVRGERPGDRPLIRLDGEAEVVANAVLERQLPGQETGVRRQRLGRV
jgi:hypothetical protein